MQVNCCRQSFTNLSWGEVPFQLDTQHQKIIIHASSFTKAKQVVLGKRMQFRVSDLSGITAETVKGNLLVYILLLLPFLPPPPRHTPLSASAKSKPSQAAAFSLIFPSEINPPPSPHACNPISATCHRQQPYSTHAFATNGRRSPDLPLDNG